LDLIDILTFEIDFSIPAIGKKIRDNKQIEFNNKIMFSFEQFKGFKK
jgi:hypothetical protein